MRSIKVIDLGNKFNKETSKSNKCLINLVHAQKRNVKNDIVNVLGLESHVMNNVNVKDVKIHLTNMNKK